MQHMVLLGSVSGHVVDVNMHKEYKHASRQGSPKQHRFATIHIGSGTTSPMKNISFQHSPGIG